MKEQVKNIVIIGMPGCGKTTIGKLVSCKLNKRFIDLDEYIVNSVGCTIPEIFKKGEEYFRDIESEAAKQVSIEQGIVISTGGGIIKKSVNIDNLKKNGIIFFIDRPMQHIISDVDTASRPLLKKGAKEIEKLFKERYDIYNSYCDFSVDNSCDIEKVIDDIIKIYKHCI